MKLISMVAVSALALCSAMAQAKVVKYELDHLTSENSLGGVHYEGLDLSGATSATLTVNKVPGAEPVLTSLVMTFPDAMKFSATNFKKIGEGFYSATVAGPWVFKEVFVDIEVQSLELGQGAQISAHVSERTLYTLPSSSNKGEVLFTALGLTKDATPTRIVSTKKVVLDSISYTVALRDRLATLNSTTDARSGFVLDVTAPGSATKKIIFPGITFSVPDIDKYEAVSLVVEPMPGSNMQWVKIQYRQIGTTAILTTQPVAVPKLLIL